LFIEGGGYDAIAFSGFVYKIFCLMNRKVQYTFRTFNG